MVSENAHTITSKAYKQYHSLKKIIGFFIYKMAAELRHRQPVHTGIATPRTCAADASSAD